MPCDSLIDKVSLIAWRGEEEGRKGRGVKSSISAYFHTGYPVPLRWMQNVTVFVHTNYIIRLVISAISEMSSLFTDSSSMANELHAIKSTAEQKLCTWCMLKNA